MGGGRVAPEPASDEHRPPTMSSPFQLGLLSHPTPPPSSKHLPSMRTPPSMQQISAKRLSMARTTTMPSIHRNSTARATSGSMPTPLSIAWATSASMPTPLNHQLGSLASYLHVPHPSPGKGTCLSSTGVHLLRYGFTSEIKVLSTSNGEVVHTFCGSPGMVTFATFSPDGRYVVAASEDCLLLVFDLEAAKAGKPALVSTTDVGLEPLLYCLMCPHGKHVLSCDDDGQLELWDVKKESRIYRFEKCALASKLASFALGGSVVISCNQESVGVILLDTSSGEVIFTEDFDMLQERRDKPAYAISPDGLWVIVYIQDQVWGDNLAVFDTKTQTYAQFTVCSGAVLHAEFSVDGNQFLAAGRDNLIHMYETDSGVLLGELAGHSHDVLFCRMNADGAFAVSADNAGTVLVWDVKRHTLMFRLQAHTSPVLFCDISVDGSRAITLDSLGHAYLWFLDAQAVFDILSVESEKLCCSCMTDDSSHMVVGYSDGSIKMWKMGLKIQKVWEHWRHTTPVVQLSASPRRTLVASGSRDGTVLLTCLTTGSVLADIPISNGTITGIHFTSSGSGLLVSARCGSLHKWSDLKPAEAGAWCDIPGEGGCDGHEAHMISKMKVGRNSQAHKSVVRTGHRSTLAFRSAAHVSARVGNSSVTKSSLGIRGLLELRDGVSTKATRCISYSFKVPVEVSASALSPDGLLAAVACVDGMLSVWDIELETLRFSFQVSKLSVSSATFSLDGKAILVGSLDGSVCVFDTVGAMLHSFPPNASGIAAVLFEYSDTEIGGCAEVSMVLALCARQAVVWDLGGRFESPVSVADFIWDPCGFSQENDIEGSWFVAHDTMALYDPTLQVAIYDTRAFEGAPGDSYMFRKCMALSRLGEHNKPVVIHTTPHDPITMLQNEAGGAMSLDFSADGLLVVCGNNRGELSLYSVLHKQLMNSWMAHKRSAITCVKFSHDATQVYSCGLDCKVHLWNWRTADRVGTLSGHESAVSSVEMSQDGLRMMSGDKDGTIILWDTTKHTPTQVIRGAHNGSILSGTISPDGSMIASSGTDEHISIRCGKSGKELAALDDALDGKGLTIKFSFDGTRLQVGGENGNILIWDVVEDCLVFEIQAHEGAVYDCSWSGDSRQLLSVGADGRVRLWDATGGSEICEANFEVGFRDVETGGFIRADLSSNGSTMVGATAKGHLIQWDIERELLKCPTGGMLYHWMHALTIQKADKLYQDVNAFFPLLMNAQDSKGWTILMHAVTDSNPEITKIILNNVKQKSAMLGLTTSKLAVACRDGVRTEQLQRSQQWQSFGGLDVSETGAGPRATSRGRSSLWRRMLLYIPFSRRRFAAIAPAPSVHLSSVSSAGMGRGSSKVGVESPSASTTLPAAIYHFSALRAYGEPNALKIAIEGMSADCVSHLLDAVLAEKVTAGSYAAVTQAIPDVAAQYPETCYLFLAGLPLRDLGCMEVPSELAAQGTIVMASKSYTSYKEMWHDKLQLSKIPRGPMVMMQASMVQLPYAASLGPDTILCTLVAAGVPLRTFGCKSIKAVINYKWKQFAQWRIFFKALVYLALVVIFTMYAILRSEADPNKSFAEMAHSENGRTIISLCILIFLFGSWYLRLEFHQLLKLGFRAYFSSGWNYLDLSSYIMCLAISLCELLRVGLAYSEFMWPLVAVETVLLWVKAAFFGLAVDGLGTFIYMLVRIVMGMRYFLLLLVIMWVMFGVALMNLFAESHVYGDAPPNSPDYNETYGNTLDPREDTIFVSFSTFGRALMTSYMVTYGSTDYGPLEPYPALATRHPVIAVILICLFNFVIILLFMSILITLYGELYRQIRAIQDFVFLENRADLVIEVESTMSDAELEARKMPPFLHLLTPIKAGDQDDDDNEGDEVMKSTKLLEDALRKSEHPDMKHYLARRIKSVPEEEEPQISPHSEYDDGYEEQQALVFDELSHEVSRLRSLIDSLAIRVKTRRSLDESDGLTGELSSMLHRLGTLSTGIAQHAVSANSPEVRTSKIAFA